MESGSKKTEFKKQNALTKVSYVPPMADADPIDKSAGGDGETDIDTSIVDETGPAITTAGDQDEAIIERGSPDDNKACRTLPPDPAVEPINDGGEGAMDIAAVECGTASESFIVADESKATDVSDPMILSAETTKEAHGGPTKDDSDEEPDPFCNPRTSKRLGRKQQQRPQISIRLSQQTVAKEAGLVELTPGGQVHVSDDDDDDDDDAYFFDRDGSDPFSAVWKQQWSYQDDSLTFFQETHEEQHPEYRLHKSRKAQEALQQKLAALDEVERRERKEVTDVISQQSR
jgi:hypothetical protein